jgi:competence protein ComEA
VRTPALLLSLVLPFVACKKKEESPQAAVGSGSSAPANKAPEPAPAPAPAPAPTEATPAEALKSPPPPLDLNTATEKDLEALPEVGQVKAKSIIASRNARGGRFESIDDLAKIDGIGPKTVDAIRPLVVLLPKAGKVDLNKATQKELENLPGIGPVHAKSIIASRNARGGKFKSIDELEKIDGIGPKTVETIRPYLELK